ncbi:hypothetical protein IJV79_01330 [bacterium]|nr:hypothetical protein [bacterium]
MAGGVNGASGLDAAQRALEAAKAQNTTDIQTHGQATSELSGFKSDYQTSNDLFVSCGQTAEAANTALEQVKSNIQSLNGELTGLTGSYQTAADAYTAELNANPESDKLTELKTKMDEAKAKVEAKEKEISDAKKEEGVKQSDKQSADIALQKAESKMTQVDAQVKKAEEAAEKAKVAVDKSTEEVKTAEKNVETAKAEEAKKQEEAKKAETKTGGTEVTKTKNADGTTTTKEMNSREFRAQQNNNIETALDIQDQYRDSNSISEECSMNDNVQSARVTQTQNLAQVEYTPELTSRVGEAIVFEDEVSSANNQLNGASSAVRNKSEAVDLYLAKSGIEPSGDGKYLPADVYAAEYAVSALQPDIVNNAKATVAYQDSFKDGTATPENIDTAIDRIKNGSTFENNGALGEIGKSETRQVSDKFDNLGGTPLLNPSEANNLTNKLESLKNGEQVDFSQRELNALSYLEGTSDIQGFPTVPAGMQWILPDAAMTTDTLPPLESKLETTALQTKEGSVHINFMEKSDDAEVNEAINRFATVMESMSFNYKGAQSEHDTAVPNDVASWTSFQLWADQEGRADNGLTVGKLIDEGALPENFCELTGYKEDEVVCYPKKTSGLNANSFTAESLVTSGGKANSPKGTNGSIHMNLDVLRNSANNAYLAGKYGQ